MIQRTRVFLDASVLLAAAGSPDGGSSAAIELQIGSQRYEALVSADVLREALKNVTPNSRSITCWISSACQHPDRKAGRLGTAAARNFGCA